MKKQKYLEKIIIGFILFTAAVILQMAARNSTGFANWYTGTIYPLWVNTFGRLCSAAAFSVVEVLLYFLLAALVCTAGLGIIHMIRREKMVSDVLLAGSGNIVLLVGGLFFLYTAMCGINYHSDAFSKLNGLEIKRYTVEQLTAYCEMITGEVNRLSPDTDRDKLKNLRANGEEAVVAMRALGEKYEGLGGYYPRPKGLLISEILSYQHLTGIYSPFTIEANYNADMTAYNIPFTMCHELSHLRGFMREDEANYIAYLASSNSDNTEFRYSGALMAWIYSTNLLYDYDKEAYWRLHDSLDMRALEDLEKNTAFWKRYEGKISEVSDKVNDTYLKANKQTDGVESYDRMVDLLMAEFLS